MRKLAKLALVSMLALALAVSMGLPAGAETLGGGAVTGTVRIENAGCIPVATASPAPVTYTFSDVAIPGVLAATSGQAAVGIVDVANVKGASVPPHDNTVSGQGFVNTSADRATFSGGLITPVTGNFYGNYMRVGSIVLVDLNVEITVGTGPAETTGVTVAAHFQPTSGDGFVAPVCEAFFGGVYGTA